MLNIIANEHVKNLSLIHLSFYGWKVNGSMSESSFRPQRGILFRKFEGSLFVSEIFGEVAGLKVDAAVGYVIALR